MDSDQQLDADPEAPEKAPEQQDGEAAVKSDAAPADLEDTAGAAPTEQDEPDGDLPDDEAELLSDGSEANPYADGAAQEDYR